MEGVAHWGIDLVDPGQRFTVAEFQAYTMKIREIRSHNCLHHFSCGWDGFVY